MSYYYAGGERVVIERDDAHVALDPTTADRAGLGSLVERATKTGARTLPGGVVVIPRSQLDEAAIGKLRHERALGGVYRHGESVMVALPEVRVEMDDERQRGAVLATLDRLPHAAEVLEQSAERLVLRPRSGSGDDALEIANFVYEQAHPAMSSVRFVQFVRRPKPGR